MTNPTNAPDKAEKPLSAEEVYDNIVGKCSQNHGYEKQIKSSVCRAMQEYAALRTSEQAAEIEIKDKFYQKCIDKLNKDLQFEHEANNQLVSAIKSAMPALVDAELYGTAKEFKSVLATTEGTREGE